MSSLRSVGDSDIDHCSRGQRDMISCPSVCRHKNANMSCMPTQCRVRNIVVLLLVVVREFFNRSLLQNRFMTHTRDTPECASSWDTCDNDALHIDTQSFFRSTHPQSGTCSRTWVLHQVGCSSSPRSRCADCRWTRTTRFRSSTCCPDRDLVVAVMNNSRHTNGWWSARHFRLTWRQ